MRLLSVFLCVWMGSGSLAAEWNEALLEGGDILLQKTAGGQSVAVQSATDSPYTHAALVFMRDGEPVVLEAVEPVRWTPLGSWLKRGKKGHVVVLRLKDKALLEGGGLAKLHASATSYLGLHYDGLFQWSDEQIYCSELVFKAYKSALGVEVGEQARGADLVDSLACGSDLSSLFTERGGQPKTCGSHGGTLSV